MLRLITADDPEQVRQAREYLKREGGHAPFWINQIVLCALIWSLTRGYSFDRARVVAEIALLLRSDEVTIADRKVVEDALYVFQTSNADFADCLIGMSNGLAGCELTATFDRRPPSSTSSS